MPKRQPTLEDFRRLQRQVDAATQAWSEAATSRKPQSYLNELHEEIDAAKRRMSAVVAEAPDPDAARAHAEYAATDRTREGRPTSVGDRVVAGLSSPRKLAANAKSAVRAAEIMKILAGNHESDEEKHKRVVAEVNQRATDAVAAAKQAQAIDDDAWPEWVA